MCCMLKSDLLEQCISEGTHETCTQVWGEANCSDVLKAAKRSFPLQHLGVTRDVHEWYSLEAAPQKAEQSLSENPLKSSVLYATLRPLKMLS